MTRERKGRAAAIMASARELFEQKGFETTTIDDITSRAQVSKGLAYHYFRSKDDILRELIRARLDELDDLIERMRAEKSAVRRLRILVSQLVTELTEGEDRQRFLVTTFLQKQHHKLVTKAMQQSPERFAALQAEELRLLADLGHNEAQKELPLFRATLQGMVMLYLLNPHGFPLHDVGELFVQRYTKGVAQND